MSEARAHVTPEERAGIREAVKKDNPRLTSFEIDAVMPMVEARFLSLENATVYGTGSTYSAPRGLLSYLDEEAPEQPPT